VPVSTEKRVQNLVGTSNKNGKNAFEGIIYTYIHVRHTSQWLGGHTLQRDAVIGCHFLLINDIYS